MGAFAQAPMRSRRPAVRVRYGAAHRADGSTQRQQPTRQAYGESDPTGDATPILTGLRRTFYAVLGMVLSRSAVLAGWQRRQGVELGLVQGDVGRDGVGGNLHFSFGADDRRGDCRAG
jgi:hypothetical protein